ncbi:SDR family oxidoreductase [Nodosilinea sp. LEGE 06152]|uniref:SDR family oxidoreductase n=1 Tax=Nodosilinea sp. LEGE 06152 TaxID=2777966 RepID=UPI00188186CB|nr:SDR family oxidoreductase [Nodosilinea sp. LEGE 06152]MBE9160717.1 SDR family oxidoreductase [Nodosilinea sp. LEGE 06152]
MQIENAVALVTGANGGIGKHYTETLLALGATRIYAGARKISSLDDLVAIDPDRIIPVALDITDETTVEAAALQCSDVNLLINNAGIGLLKGFISAPNLSAARSEMEVNYFGTLAMCRAFAPVLKANGGGAVINMLSILGRVNFPMNASYSASKGAGYILTQGVRAELAAQNTLVIGVMPATVDTPVSQDFPPPKVAPETVVQAALQAVVDGVEDVYPGEQAETMAAQLLSDPKGLEKAMAAMLPQPA